jgi:hypothetical protein
MRGNSLEVMNGPTLTRSYGVARIDLRDHELDAAEATSLLDILALPDLERVVIEIHDRRSLGASATVLLCGLEAHIGLHGVAVEVREDAGPTRRDDRLHPLDV